MKTFDAFQRRNCDNKRRAATITTKGLKPFEIISIDTIGPITGSAEGNEYILTINDTLTRYAIAEKLSDMEENTIIEALKRRVVFIYCPPRVMLSNRGTSLCSARTEAFNENFNISEE